MEEKKRKRKPHLLTFQPSGPPRLLPQRPVSAPSFSFSPHPLTPGPHLSAPPYPFFLPPLPFLCSTRSRTAAALAAPVQLSPPSFPSLTRNNLELNPRAPSSLNYSAVSRLHHPQCSPATYGKAAGRRTLPLPLPLFLCPYLSSSLISRPPLCTHITPTHA
jgi:hypothetical protein